MAGLYSFKELETFLDKKGFPKLQSQKIEVVRADLTTKQNEGKIEFRNDAVYLLHNNIWQKGYMYIKNADVKQYGLPKFHIIECSVIKRYKNKGWFDGHYFWSNEERVDIQQRKSKKIYSNVVLSLCNICRDECKQVLNYESTDGFFDLLDIEDKKIDFENVEVDIFGYPKDWRQKSDKFRIENNWTCDKCKLNLSEDIMYRRFLEVHHRDRNKKNNTRENLQCLCICCHTGIDQLHIDNYEKNESRKIQMKTFIDKYGDCLKRLHKKDNL